jgi:hypothetical protein
VLDDVERKWSQYAVTRGSVMTIGWQADASFQPEIVAAIVCILSVSFDTQCPSRAVGDRVWERIRMTKFDGL